MIGPLIRPVTIALALLSVLPFTAVAQMREAPAAPSNLRFEEGEAGGKPPGWFTPPNWTIVEMRRGEGCREGGCVMMTRPAEPPPNSFGNLMQVVSGKAFAGKRVVYRVALRVEGDTGEDVAMAWLRVDRPDRQMGFFDNMQDRPVKAGSGWAVYEIAGDVAADAVRIYFGVMAHGRARVWVDEATLEATEQPSQVEAPPEVRDALTKLYQRLDAATNAGRVDEVAAMALPDARGGGFSMKVPLSQWLTEMRKFGATGAKLTNRTTIIEAKLVGGNEAHVRARSEGTLEKDGKTQHMRGTANDIWVRREDGWKLKETIVTSMREVAGPGSVLGSEAVQRVARAIGERAVPLTTPSAGGPREELVAFGKAVGDARIVSLGEATHGTREIFQMKHRLLEYLVREKGFTVFAIEANWPESEAADRYIKTGEGDPRQALRDMYFWTWQTEEVLAMLEWMREFNKAPGNHPVLSFTAFDMQEWKVAAARVREFIKRHGSAEDQAALDAAYQGLAALPARAMRDAAFVRAADEAEKAVELLSARREALTKAGGASAAAFRDVLQVARIVVQALRNRTPGATVSYRDEMMAKNVEWLAREAHPGEKIVLWAHNAHVSASVTEASGWQPMGWWLRKSMGRQMYVLGFGVHTGTVRAVATGAQGRGLGVQTMPPTPASYGTAVLSAVGKPMFYLDLTSATAAGGEAGAWLRSRQPFRECGSMWALEDPGENNSTSVSLADSYDGLIYFEKSEAARGLN